MNWGILINGVCLTEFEYGWWSCYRGVNDASDSLQVFPCILNSTIYFICIVFHDTNISAKYVLLPSSEANCKTCHESVRFFSSMFVGFTISPKTMKIHIIVDLIPYNLSYRGIFYIGCYKCFTGVWTNCLIEEFVLRRVVLLRFVLSRFKCVSVYLFILYK